MTAEENEKAKALLDRIVAMLTKLGQRGYAVHEESEASRTNPSDPDPDTDPDPDASFCQKRRMHNPLCDKRLARTLALQRKHDRFNETGATCEPLISWGLQAPLGVVSRSAERMRPMMRRPVKRGCAPTEPPPAFGVRWFVVA
jgi:hypothetical protein